MRRIMLVDDETSILKALQRVVLRAMTDVKVETFDDPKAALARMSEMGFDLVVSDYRMPVMDGISFLSEVKQVQPDTVRLVLSAQADMRALVEAINRAEIFRFLAKPWDDDELIATLQAALVRRDAVLQERRLADEQRVARGEMTPAEMALRRLEEEEPGISRVDWTPEGGISVEEWPVDQVVTSSPKRG
ncbi:MAG TPA: response regulator [Rhodocyclaceae bacterium]|nr:response regulator [Rhodocyclaceae bacterium]